MAYSNSDECGINIISLHLKYANEADEVKNQKNIQLSVLTAIFPREPMLTGFIGTMDNGIGVDNWSYKKCKAPVKSSPPITPNFLQAGCPSCGPTNSVEALKGNKIKLN